MNWLLKVNALYSSSCKQTVSKVTVVAVNVKQEYPGHHLRIFDSWGTRSVGTNASKGVAVKALR